MQIEKHIEGYTAHDSTDDLQLVQRGFLAMLPLWTGAIPVGVAYAVAAHSAGLGWLETQLASLTVFSAAAQLGAVSLGQNAAPVEFVVVALALNVQLLLLGLTAGRTQRHSLKRQMLLALFLTDGAFAIAAREGVLRWQVLFGAGMSMYLGWNVGTAIGLLGGATLPLSDSDLVRLVAPLTFIAVLVPLLRGVPALATSVAAGTTFVALRELPTGIAILVAALVGCIVGDWCQSRSTRAERLP
jgi:predicted branched-subunit amino acid permease